MKSLAVVVALLAPLAWMAPAGPHGASYPPPDSDTQPPPPGGAGGGGGGGYGGPGDTSPGAPAPAAGGLPSRPSTGSAGGAPSTPSGLPMSGPAGAGSGPSSGGQGGPTVDLAAWHFWWHFNQEPYLRLKERVWAAAPTTDGAELYLGRGSRPAAASSRRPSPREVHEQVVPALARALERERSNDIASSCLIALARIGDRADWVGPGLSPMASLLRTRLSSSSQEIQETAALALGVLANEQNVFLLTQLLDDDREALRAFGVDFRGAVPQRTRAFAAYALGLIGESASVPARAEIARVLAERLDEVVHVDARVDLSVACVTALGLTPLPSRPGASRDGEPSRPDPLRLRRLEDQVEWLLALYEDSTVTAVVRAHLPIALARLLEGLPPQTALRQRAGLALVRDLGPRVRLDDRIRQSCALALGRLADSDADLFDLAAREALQRVVGEVADRQTRFFALLSLAQASSRPGSGEGDPLSGLSGKRGTRAFLLEALANGRSGLRPWAALALGLQEHALAQAGRPASDDVRAALRRVLEEARAPEEIGALAIANGLCGGSAASEVLLRRFEDTSEAEALAFLATGLGLAGERAALEPLRLRIDRSRFRPQILRWAAIGAALLGDADVSVQLGDMLAAASSLSAQAAACEALGFIGDRRSLPVLLELLADAGQTDLARAFAAVALGRVADKRALPWRNAVSLSANYRADVPTFYDPLGTSGLLNLY